MGIGDAGDELEPLEPSVKPRSGSSDIPFFRIAVALSLVVASFALMMSASAQRQQAHTSQTQLCIVEAQARTLTAIRTTDDRQRADDAYQRAVRRCLNEPEPPPTSTTTTASPFAGFTPPSP